MAEAPVGQDNNNQENEINGRIKKHDGTGNLVRPTNKGARIQMQEDLRNTLIQKALNGSSCGQNKKGVASQESHRKILVKCKTQRSRQLPEFFGHLGRP